MQIAIRERGLGLSADGRAYAIDRVMHALAAVRDQVRKVMVYLSDENGPRGGADKRCRVAVSLAAVGRPVVVEVSGLSVSGAVDRAANKVGEVVHQELHRRDDRHRSNRVARALKQLKRLFGRNGGQS